MKAQYFLVCSYHHVGEHTPPPQSWELECYPYLGMLAAHEVFWFMYLTPFWSSEPDLSFFIPLISSLQTTWPLANQLWLENIMRTYITTVWVWDPQNPSSPFSYVDTFNVPSFFGSYFYLASPLFFALASWLPHCFLMINSDKQHMQSVNTSM